MRKYQFEVSPEYEQERIDKCLTELIDFASRSFIQKKIKDQNVFVNGNIVKPSYLVKEGDEIYLEIPDSMEPEILAEDIPLSILYEDADLLVVNKPKNMVVHPSAGHYSGTLVNAILFHCKEDLSGINGVLRPGIVHRIDKNTTGSLIICKNDHAHKIIADQLANHSIHRVYHAICHGSLNKDEGTIEGNIGRDVHDRLKMTVVSSGGKRAVTHYKVLERFKDYTYIQCILETGRTHQIRVHMSSIGHPIVGDDVYSNRKCSFHLTGQTLHAKTIGFIHPTTEKYMEFDAPLPAYFEEMLHSLRIQNKR